MGAAVRQQAVTRFLQDLLRFGEGADIAERVVRPEEARLKVADLPDLRDTLVLGVARGDERCPFNMLHDYTLQSGDVVVFITSANSCTRDDAESS